MERVVVACLAYYFSFARADLDRLRPKTGFYAKSVSESGPPHMGTKLEPA